MDTAAKNAAQRIAALNGTVSATILPDGVRAIVKDADFKAIGEIVDDVRADDDNALRCVEIVALTECPAGADDRFRAVPDMVLSYDEDGRAIVPEHAKLFAHHLGITTPPTLNVICGNATGLLFATVADAEVYDASLKRG